jgi:hypothetical protein
MSTELISLSPRATSTSASFAELVGVTDLVPWMRYDSRPVLFEARCGDAAVLGVFVDESETMEVFVVVEIADRRLSAIRAGLVPLRDAFERPDGRMFSAALENMRDVNGLPFTGATRVALPGPLPEAWLPAPVLGCAETPGRTPLRLLCAFGGHTLTLAHLHDRISYAVLLRTRCPC